jgi:hypothetical protein
MNHVGDAELADNPKKTDMHINQEAEVAMLANPKI